ncbi:D-TA family PLP-dependent enzyme [Verrucomicrobium spinosum]|uniref:D-TA family PLP-dependent enzyme n=1 Tax=Verrucomicrobium spinosum TaxID=2736 RepID=UPI00017448A1|nr:D-TA family PLP-dependent enzyme [Verrucomicrobium spinosum]
MSAALPWYAVENIDEIPSPSLLVYPDRIEENLRRMIAMVGDVQRLRPHMKTHKMPDVIKLHLALGITKFKCATIAEAEMTAEAGAKDILLAYPLVGPNIARFLKLKRQYPQTRFCAVADDADAARALSAAAGKEGVTVEVMLEVNCGMARTGIAPGEGAIQLYQLLATLPNVQVAGIHAYDGHIHDHDLAARTSGVEVAYQPVEALRDRLLALGLSVPHYVVSGTPTFGIHARRGSYECSPGTCVVWDWGYGTKHPDLDFLHAALVVTRVISKPAPERLTLDLGHKAIAAENPHPRVYLLNLPDAKAVMHSEEHLAVETPLAGDFPVGSVVYGVPWHICPTVALHSHAFVVRGGRADGTWKVAGRERVITV